MSNGAVTELASGKLIVDEPADEVLRIRISNPDKRGALDHEILDTLAQTVGSVQARCLIVTGSGPVFSAGYDIGNFSRDRFAVDAEHLVAHPFTEAIEAVEAYPYPVIAALNGHAIGGGLELAVACDLRIAAHGIRLGMPPAKIGLIYGHTGLRRFIDVIGAPNTKELFYLGRNIDPDRACQMGLVNWVVEPDDIDGAALRLAGEIAANSPLSLSGNKRIIRTLMSHQAALPHDVERELVELRESCFTTEDFAEGVQAFAEKRRPNWKGR